jgi:alkylation response protein AidB-like acyl-CoA dehydrogenase
MTDGAAKLLGTHLSSNYLDAATGRIFQDAYDRLTSRDPHFAWTSGQWMTERSGGSDVSRTETVATFVSSSIQSSPPSTPLGPWSIDGFKWFSSATDSSMSILLAQTPKGLSTFFAPIYRSISKPSLSSSDPEKELNGISISRLKNKFGTKSLPTAELELKGTRAYLIGKEGQGIQEISMILNISRLYSAVSATGYLGRGLAIARSFAVVREVGAGKGRRVMLTNAPLHMSTLSKITGEYHAMMLFNFFVAYLMGISEHRVTGLPTSRLTPSNPKDVSLLLRILTPVLKGAVCKRSIHALQECMEALGGVGYLDNTENEAINISRLYRDCCVLSIWEGTTDVLATDMLRVLKGQSGSDVLNALELWISTSLEVRGAHPTPFQSESKMIERYFTNWRETIGATESDELLPHARQLLFEVADIVMSVLLITDAGSDGDEATMVLCSRFLLDHNILGNIVSTGKSTSSLEMNQKIVYGKTIQETCSQTDHRESSKL